MSCFKQLSMIIFSGILLFILINLNEVYSFKHNCIKVEGSENDNVFYLLSNNTNSTNQIELINKDIIDLVSLCSFTLNVTDASDYSNQTTTGNLNDIRSEIIKRINNQNNLNNIQIAALEKMIDNAIILEEAKFDKKSPKPVVSFRVSSSNETFTLKW